MSLLNINQMLTIILNQNNDSHIFSSRIADIHEDMLAIEFPIHGTNGKDVVIFSPGITLNIDFIYNNNRYQLVTEIMDKTEDRIPLLLVSKPDEKKINKIQLRENFRVPANIQVDMNYNYEKMKVYTIDVSTGGLSFYDKASICMKGDKISGEIHLPLSSETDLPLSFSAEVIRVTAQSSNEELQKTAVKFIELEEKDRSRIVQYCFKRQLELRNKGIKV